MALRGDFPTGTVTFLFTDVEGSTRLLRELGVAEYAGALAAHRRVIRAACSRHAGVEVDTQGDAFFMAFPTASGAVAAAVAINEALSSSPIALRMGVHTGTPLLTEDGYIGGDVHRAARIAASGHGGQVLVSVATAALLDSPVLRDLGEHRLKDLSAPERLFQLGDATFPPLNSLHQMNLPIPSTPFLGRRKELAEVLRLLSQPDRRLLTMTGPGGIGKTRLALEAAAEIGARYADGVWLVPLAASRDPELVVQSAERVLGATRGLAEHIAGRSMLLLFDNFEQVVEAAVNVAGLLVTCPNLRLLVTSREPLHVRGEQEYAVPPFAHDEGVDFFLARARAIKLDFANDDAVSKICRRLDELPLALELAASRVKALSSDQILERLEQRLPLLIGGARDMPERQRTLRAAIGWSYELLEPAEQRLFARLSVFRGGFTLALAELVADANLDTLQSLVDKSLVRLRQNRFSMLETIREYASERLADSGEAEEMSRRHTDAFLALADQARPDLHEGGRTGEWIDRIERDHDNVRAALDRVGAAGDSERASRLAETVSSFWEAFGAVAGLCRDALALSLAGEAVTAVRLLACAETLRQEIGYQGSWLAAMNDETLLVTRSQLDEGAFAEAWEQGRLLTLGEALVLAVDGRAELTGAPVHGPSWQRAGLRDGPP